MYFWLICFIFFVFISLLFQLQLFPITIITGILSAMIFALIGYAFIVQLFVFALFSLLSWIIILIFSMHYRETCLVDFNAPANLIFKSAIVIEQNTPYNGKIYINHQLWNITSLNKIPFHVGDKVQILSCSGNTLLVHPKDY